MDWEEEKGLNLAEGRLLLSSSSLHVKPIGDFGARMLRWGQLEACIYFTLWLAHLLLWKHLFLTSSTSFHRDHVPRSVWPDWAIFWISRSHFFHKSSPNIMVYLGIFKNTTFMENLIWLLFRQYWEKLGNFLLHHLVTLSSILLQHHLRNKSVVSQSLTSCLHHFCKIFC